MPRRVICPRRSAKPCARPWPVQSGWAAITTPGRKRRRPCWRTRRPFFILTYDGSRCLGGRISLEWRIPMAKVSFANVEDAPVVAPANEVAGNVETRGLFARDKDPLQLRHHHLQPGAKIHFKGKPSDKVIF